MNSLGGIELPAGMQWSEAGQAQGRRTTLRTALDGSPVVFAAPAPARITLVAGDSYGWIEEEVAKALLQLSETTLATTLAWGDFLRAQQAYTVAFDHESGPAVQLEPLWPGCDQYTGRIALIVL